MKRKFYDGEIYHICNKSISNYQIFSKDYNCQRFIELLDYYNHLKVRYKYSIALQLNTYEYINCLFPRIDQIVKIISYCIMPDHYHLLLKILNSDLFSLYISNINNSYTRFFNLKNHRKGPLWQSRFRSVLIKNNEQLLHTIRYIHLNPVTNYLVNKPIEWKFSSYRDYVSDPKILSEIMKEISIKDIDTFKKFTEDQIDYQRQLKKIKKLLLE